MEQEAKKRSSIKTILKWVAILFVIFIAVISAAVLGCLTYSFVEHYKFARQTDQIQMGIMKQVKTLSAS